MRTAERPFARLLALLLALALVAAACGDDDDDTAAPDGTEEPAGDGGLSGEVVVSGSSTVEPISARNAEKFSAENPDVAISVDGPGTGDGFEIFCNGESDVSDASRPIKEEEVATCAENGIEFVELKVGIDGLSIVTSNDNEIECLSFLDAYALLGPESTGLGQWSDAADLASELAGALGEDFGASHADEYPDGELVVTAPGEESGTYDSFVEIVLEGIAEERGQEPVARPDYQASPNDNVIVEGISGTATSLGWVGYAFVANNPEAVRAVAVDGGEGCVEPTPESIADGSFPIARPLFIYVNAARAEESPALEAYIDFYMSDEGFASVSEVGYVDLESGALEETRAAWEARETGTRESS